MQTGQFTKRVSAMVTPGQFDAIERARGKMPRERWIRWAVTTALETNSLAAGNGVSRPGAFQRAAQR